MSIDNFNLSEYSSRRLTHNLKQILEINRKGKLDDFCSLFDIPKSETEQFFKHVQYFSSKELTDQLKEHKKLAKAISIYLDIQFPFTN